MGDQLNLFQTPAPTPDELLNAALFVPASTARRASRLAPQSYRTENLRHVKGRMELETARLEQLEKTDPAR